MGANIIGDPRLCRGGSRSLTFPAVCALAVRCGEEREPFKARRLIPRRCKFLHQGWSESDSVIKCPEASLYPRIVRGWELGPFEGPPTLKPPALPGDTYCCSASLASATWAIAHRARVLRSQRSAPPFSSRCRTPPILGGVLSLRPSATGMSVPPSLACPGMTPIRSLRRSAGAPMNACFAGPLPSRSRRSTTACPPTCAVRGRDLQQQLYVGSGRLLRANSGHSGRRVECAEAMFGHSLGAAFCQTRLRSINNGAALTGFRANLIGARYPPRPKPGRIAAILAAVGYSRLVGADEDRTSARLRTLRGELLDPTIAVHGAW